MENGAIKAKALCIVSRNGEELLAGLGRDDVKGEDFGRLMGGTVEFGETSLEALRREFKEELDTEIDDIELIEVIENLFTYNGIEGHEILFVYKARLSNEALYGRNDLHVLDKPDVKVGWISLADIENGTIKLHPELNYRKLLS